MKMPAGFMEGREFVGEDFDSLQGFYRYCNRCLNEANRLLEKVNDAIRKYLIGAGLTGEEEKLLFGGDSLEPTCSSSVALSLSNMTQQSHLEEVLPGLQDQEAGTAMILENEASCIETMRNELISQNGVIISQRETIDSLHQRLSSVVSNLMPDDDQS